MTNRFQPYSSYQDTGLDWLGCIPETWELRRLGNYFRERRAKASDTEFSALSVTMQGIVPQLDTAAKTKDGDNRKLVRAGDFVINSRSDRKGSAGISPSDGSVSLISIVLEPVGIYPLFAHHLLRSSAFQEEFYRFGKGIVADLWSTSYAAMKNIVIPVMSLEEQTQIAKFLDYETAKIDALIEKQQQLIALLKEKRQAVISHAVTKGLNPDVPMRDSGVEWLGEIPAHWCLAKLKSFAEVVDPNPSHRNPEYVDDGFPFISTVEFVEDGGVETDTPRRVSEATVVEQEERCQFREGSIAFSRKGTIGAVRLLPTHIRFALLDSVCVVNPLPDTDPRYLLFWLTSAPVMTQIDLGRRGAALPQLSVGAVRDLCALLPPLVEQQAIARHLGGMSVRIDSLIRHVQDQIELLKERRTALISAAVTGKIDLRDWKSPTSEREEVVA